MDELNEFIVNDLWKVVSSKENRESKLQKLVEVISSFLKVEKCSLMLKEDGIFKIVASVGLPKKIIKDTQIEEGEGISGMVIKERKAIFMRKISESIETDGRYKTDGFISTPLFSTSKDVIGILNLTDKKENMSLSEKDLIALKPIMERIRFVVED